MYYPIGSNCHAGCYLEGSIGQMFSRCDRYITYVPFMFHSTHEFRELTMSFFMKFHQSRVDHFPGAMLHFQMKSTDLMPKVIAMTFIYCVSRALRSSKMFPDFPVTLTSVSVICSNKSATAFEMSLTLSSDGDGSGTNGFRT